MASKKQTAFTEQFSELEEITRWFERGDGVDLEEGLKKYERGLALAALCRARLKEIENKVTHLKKNYDSDVSEDSGTLL